VSGVIRLKLFKGDCRVVGRKSPFALHDRALAAYDAGDAFDHAGFIKVRGVRLQADQSG
jgi:argininosuccinate synthase